MNQFKLVLSFSFTIINVAIASVPELSPNTFLFCLKPELQPLTISLNRGKPSVGMAELNDFFQTHDVVRIEPWIKSAAEIDRDGDIYLNRIYRVYLDENRQIPINQSISSIQDFPFILSAEPEYIRKPYTYPDDYHPNKQCSIASVKADEAWEYWDIPNEMPGDANILLASVDTGVDYTHPDLIENIWVNQGEITWAKEAIEVDSNDDDYVSAIEINNYMLSEVGDLNGDGVINLRDALAEQSPFLNNKDDNNDCSGDTNQDGCDCCSGDVGVDDLIGWDVSGLSGIADNDPFPKSGVQNNSEWAHGTHVAGILAATTNNGLGMASAMFNGKILSVKCSRDGSDADEPPINDGYDGITYAAKSGYFIEARTIINCSWGGSGNNTFEQSVINNAYNTYGAIVVAAAGNGDKDTHQEEYAAHYPASYDNVVSVCAMSCSGNWGNWATYHTTVDLAAPGDNIYSTIIGDGYQTWDGSSMASPNAASVMGLVWSYYPEWTNENVVEQLKLAADPFIYERNPDYIECNGNEGTYCLGMGMVDAHKAIGRGFSPNIQTGTFTFTEIIGDSDGIINPGETGYLTISLKNVFGWVDAKNIAAILSSDNPKVTIVDSNAVYGDIAAGDSLYNTNDTYKIVLSSDIELGNIDFQLLVSGESTNYYYDQSFVYENISVLLNQAGFPVLTEELRASPLVIDLDGNGKMEIIIGDNNGFIHIYNADGSEVNNNIFPYYIGIDNNFEIWGSAAAADMDRDGFMDFVIASKSKHLYIFDQNGLKTDYNANKYLMGTPAIGNLDDDADLEVVVGGYSNSNQIFAVNPDGSNVDGFPFSIGEKTKAGVALADFNGNDKDDIVFGTDDNNIYVIYDDATIAPGFPFATGDKIQAAPSVADIDGGKVIFAGSNDNSFYAINFDGSLRFTIQTGNKVQSSPSFLDHNGKTYIFFGSNDDMIYAVDSDGNALAGWPISINGTIGGSVVFSDLDNDADPEVVAATDTGNILALHLDGSYVNHFPIFNAAATSSGSPAVIDIDGDGDLEIMAGSGSNLFVADIKDIGITNNYWNLYRGGNNRRGINFVNGNCMDEEACNYDPNAEMDDGTCIYVRNGSCELGINDLSMFSSTYSISNIYPNPFNPVTTIKYGLSRYVLVKIAVYDILGRQVTVLINNYQSPGFHSISWDASSYPSGLYFIRMVSNNIIDTRKILLIK